MRFLSNESYRRSGYHFFPELPFSLWDSTTEYLTASNAKVTVRCRSPYEIQFRFFRCQWLRSSRCRSPYEIHASCGLEFPTIPTLPFSLWDSRSCLRLKSRLNERRSNSVAVLLMRFVEAIAREEVSKMSQQLMLPFSLWDSAIHNFRWRIRGSRGLPFSLWDSTVDSGIVFRTSVYLLPFSLWDSKRTDTRSRENFSVRCRSPYEILKMAVHCPNNKLKKIWLPFSLWDSNDRILMGLLAGDSLTLPFSLWDSALTPQMQKVLNQLLLPFSLWDSSSPME